jgi:hypothetical protein
VAAARERGPEREHRKRVAGVAEGAEEEAQGRGWRGHRRELNHPAASDPAAGDPGEGDADSNASDSATTPAPDGQPTPQVAPPSLPDPFEPKDDSNDPDHYLPTAPAPGVLPNSRCQDEWMAWYSAGADGPAKDATWWALYACMDAAGTPIITARADTPAPPASTVARTGRASIAAAPQRTAKKARPRRRRAAPRLHASGTRR